MDAFTAALRDALLIPSAAMSSAQVHQVIINQLRELDPQATIRTTGYFNHSWVPDLQMRWNNEEQRHLYLRFNAFDGSIVDDLRYVGADEGDPVFFDIAQPDMGLEEVDEPRAPLELGDTAAMLTEHEAWGRLGAEVRSDTDVRTATRQLLRGGRGVVDEEVAEQVVSNYRRAVSFLDPDTIDATDPDELRVALDQLEEPLSRIASLDLEGDLRTRWIGAGREPETFPSLEGWVLHDRSDEEIANLVMALLKGAEPVPDDRWREIVDAITADALGAAARHKGRVIGGKVNDLVRVGRDSWTAKWAWVPQLEDPPKDTLNWGLGGTALELNLEDHRALFSDIGTRFNTMPKPDELPYLEPRLPALDHPAVLGVTIATTEEMVGVQLRATSTEPLGERLRRLMREQADIRISGRIMRLEVRVPGTDNVVSLNFETGKASAQHPVPLARFARIVARFMVDVTTDARAQLELNLGPEETP